MLFCKPLRPVLVLARVLIEPVLASSGVIASSPNKSLNGVNPVDLETTMLSHDQQGLLRSRFYLAMKQ